MNLRNIFFYLTETDEQGNYVHNGASFDLNTSDFNPNSGYFVSLIGFEKQYEIPKDPNKWQDCVLNFLQAKVLKEMYQRDNVYIGFWIHNDILYIDLSERIEDRDEAIRQGYARNQIAIYDAANGKEIFMNKVSADADLLNTNH